MFGRKRKDTEAATNRPELVTVEIGRKELFEMGTESCGPEISAAFEAVGRPLSLDCDKPPPPPIDPSEDLVGWIWIDDKCIVEEHGHDVEIQTAGGHEFLFSAFGATRLKRLVTGRMPSRT